jgi:hypothetical protein
MLIKKTKNLSDRIYPGEIEGQRHLTGHSRINRILFVFSGRRPDMFGRRGPPDNCRCGSVANCLAQEEEFLSAPIPVSDNALSNRSERPSSYAHFFK